MRLLLDAGRLQVVGIIISGGVRQGLLRHTVLGAERQHCLQVVGPRIGTDDVGQLLAGIHSATTLSSRRPLSRGARRLSMPNQRGRSSAGWSGSGPRISRKVLSPNRMKALRVPCPGCCPPGVARTPSIPSSVSMPNCRSGVA
jgi:hypothetical protein